MELQLINFETAKLAKEKGFNIPTLDYYISSGEFINNEDYEGDDHVYPEDWNKKGWIFDKSRSRCFGCKLDEVIYFKAYAAPTQALLQKWLREKHKINITLHHTSFDTYEEALEVGLNEALKTIDEIKI
jgi:hypothetical protein